MKRKGLERGGAVGSGVGENKGLRTKTEEEVGRGGCIVQVQKPKCSLHMIKPRAPFLGIQVHDVICIQLSSLMTVSNTHPTVYLSFGDTL